MSERTHWTDELVAAELRKLAGDTGVLPAAARLREVGRNDLVCAATRSGGLIAWAARLGLRRESSDSDTGWEGEDMLVEILRGQGFAAERTGGVKHPFDIIVDGVLRVDSKAARFAEYAGSSGSRARGWHYRIGKVPQADMIVLVQLDRGDVFAFPWWSSPVTNVCIVPGNTSYECYRNNFDLIREMVTAFQKMREATPARPDRVRRTVA
jgi:hypothetical protein